MHRDEYRLGCVALLSFALCAGCTKPTGQRSTDSEKSVRDTVVAFQAALKARDAEKLWSLMDSDSQADAERAAKSVHEAYAKASAEQKAEYEKTLGVPAAALAALTGRGFLNTKRFHGKYDELPDSTIDKITIQGDTATVAYTEADG